MQGWLGSKDTILHSGEGPVQNIRWSGNLIAWANDLGVKVYDTTVHQRIAYVERPKSRCCPLLLTQSLPAGMLCPQQPVPPAPDPQVLYNRATVVSLVLGREYTDRRMQILSRQTCLLQ